MAKPDQLLQSPSEWLDRLHRSKAQIAQGQTVPLQPILDRLRASAEHLETDRHLKSGQDAPDPDQ